MKSLKNGMQFIVVEEPTTMIIIKDDYRELYKIRVSRTYLRILYGNIYQLWLNGIGFNLQLPITNISSSCMISGNYRGYDAIYYIGFIVKDLSSNNEITYMFELDQDSEECTEFLIEIEEVIAVYDDYQDDELDLEYLSLVYSELDKRY